MSSAEPSERLRWIVLTGAVSYLLWRCWALYLVATLPWPATVDLVLDDAYYYLQIAYNLVAQGRSSFDGITSTNGYQPAWMALIAAIQYALRLDKHGLFVALQALMLVTVAAPLVYCLSRAREPFFLALAAGLTASLAGVPGVYSAGLETILFAPAFVAMLVLTRAGLTASAGKAAWLFAPVVLIRLDAVSLLLAHALALGRLTWQREGRARALARILRFLAPSVVTLALYAGANYLVFASPVPLSGVAKAVGAVPFSNWGIFYNYLIQAIPVLIVALVVLPIELIWTKFEGGRLHYGGVALLALSLVFHYGYYAAFSGWIPWPWYFYAHALMVVLLVARAVEIAALVAQPTWSGSRVPGYLALGLLLTSLWLVPFAEHVLLTRQLLENQAQGVEPGGSFNRRNAAHGLALQRERAELVLAIGDRAAGLGYFAPDTVKVFALEGLVADKAYLDARRRDQGERYLRERVAPRYLVVDRERLEPVRIAGEEQYVVIEPMQGRVVMDHLLVFCFPKSALVQELRGRDDQLLVLPAPAVRATFDFAQAERCRGPFAEHAERQIHSVEPLRKRAVAVEYSPIVFGQLNELLERFDRKLALRIRAYLRGRE